MGDVGDDYKAFREYKKKQKASRKDEAVEFMKDKPAIFTDKAGVWLFREKDMPMVDYYPTTGRWRVGGKKTNSAVYSGGIKSFWAWYVKRRVNPPKCRNCGKTFDPAYDFMEDPDKFEVLVLMKQVPEQLCGKCGNECFNLIKKVVK